MNSHYESDIPTTRNGQIQFCILGADYENTNLGIRALTTGAVFAIYAQYPDAVIRIIDYGSEPRQFSFELESKTVSVDLLNIRFSKKIWDSNHIARLIATACFLYVLPFKTVRNKIISGNKWLKGMVDSDWIMSLNYGDSFSDIYGLKRFIYVSLPQVLAILLKKSLVQLPQTIGPYKSLGCKTLAKWILTRCKAVYTRDEAAVNEIKMLVPGRNADRIRFCHDLAFVVPKRTPANIDMPIENVFSDRPVVGFNVSGLLWMGGYTRNNMFGLAGDYKDLVRRSIRLLIGKKEANVLLVPHVLLGSGEGDPSACMEIWEEFQIEFPGRIYTLAPPYDEREVKHYISKCDFFVGARMHACIAALSQCVPACAFAYSGKFIGVLKSVGAGSAVADLRELSNDQALTKLESCYDSREAIRKYLEGGTVDARTKLFGIMMDLSELN